MSIELLVVLLWFAGQLIVGAAIWGAIRTDIKGIHRRLGDLHDEQKNQAERMDNLLLGIHGNRHKQL